MSGRVRRVAAWPIAIALVGAAYLVSATVPDDDALERPFAESGELGDRLLGRTIEVRLLEAVLVDEIELDGWRGTTSGIWFVAQLDAAAVLERASLIAELEIDGVTYAATERTDDVVTDRLLRVMLPIRGNMAIEMPTEVLQTAAAERAILRFKERGDVRLDSVIEFAIDLTSLERGRTVLLDRPVEVSW